MGIIDNMIAAKKREEAQIKKCKSIRIHAKMDRCMMYDVYNEMKCGKMLKETPTSVEEHILKCKGNNENEND